MSRRQAAVNMDILEALGDTEAAEQAGALPRNLLPQTKAKEKKAKAKAPAKVSSLAT